MPKRFSSLPGSSADDKAQSDQPRKSLGADRKPSPSPSRSPARLQKIVPNSQIARRPSAQLLSPTDSTGPSLQELQEEAVSSDTNPLVPPPTITVDYNARSASQDRTRPSTPRSSFVNYSRPATPNAPTGTATNLQSAPQSAPSAPPPPPSTEAPPSASPNQPASSNDPADKGKKKHWWNRGGKKDDEDKGPVAWIAGHPQKVAYDVEGLMEAQQMAEMWDNVDGNCLVYLFPRMSNRGASFKVDSAIFASSPILTKLAFGDIYSSAAVANSGDRRHIPTDAGSRPPVLTLNADPNTPPHSPKRGTEGSTGSRDSRAHYSVLSESQEVGLYLPIKLNSDANLQDAGTPPRSADKATMEDMQTLIDYRNFFAFLCGQSLVATERRSTFFAIFMIVASILKSFQFSNVDGSTFGEVANSSFDNYVEELGLADVRTSREKTIEGIVLGERMKSVFLYNEAFTHGAGKHDDLVALRNPKFTLISPITQNRLVRAAMDLEKRTESIRLTLTDFGFPFLFSGIMASKRSEERKEGVRFEQWKDSFLATRKYVMSLYKHRYGDWPPRASSKKNNLETSGLNRLVLRDVYKDMTSMYDLLVDRSNLTTRTIEGGGQDENARDLPAVRGLRAVLSENDRSVPPVKPPMPFDIPRLPTLRTTRPDFPTYPDPKSKDAKTMHKKLKDDEISKILQASWNDDAAINPFVDAFREMEKRAAHGSSIAEIEDLRIGQWLFMYSVLQTLPMLACDAPGLKNTQFVEYFLCEPPRSGVPWADPTQPGAGAARRTWFSVGGAGGGVVSLPSDAVEHSVEGIYRRSHCWQMAEKWTQSNPLLNEALHEHNHQADAIQAAAATHHSPGHRHHLSTTSSATGLGSEIPYDPADLPPPPSLRRPDSRTSQRSLGVPSARYPASQRHSSLGIGLEALPLPAGISPDGVRRTSSPGHDPNALGLSPHAPARPVTPASSTNATFDAILGNLGGAGAAPDEGKGKKGKK